MDRLSRRTLLGAVGAAGFALASCSAPNPPSAAPTPKPSPTASSTKELFRFATASDGHWGEANTPSQRYLKDLVSTVNKVHQAAPIEILVLNGDLGMGGRKRLQAARDGLDRIDPTYLAVPGNHDEVSSADWKKIWGTPVNLVRRFGDRSLILANTSNKAGDYRCANSAWLAEALTSEAEQRDVFVFMHITPKEWTKYGVDCPQVRAMLAEAPNVRAVFNGHDHDQAGIKKAAGVPYIFDSHYGGSWGTKYRAFRMVEVSRSSFKTWLVTTSGKKRDQEVISW